MNTVHGMGVSQIMLVIGFNINYIFQLFPVSILFYMCQIKSLP